MLARLPITAAACTLRETTDIANWIDIKITGPSRKAIEQAIAEYRLRHAACEPRPAFYDIHGNVADGFRVAGSRGRDPRR